MAAYLIEIDTSMMSVYDPIIIGPFDDVDEAVAFRDRWDMGMEHWRDEHGRLSASEPGISACHVVSDSTCDATPEQYPAFRLLGLD